MMTIIFVQCRDKCSVKHLGETWGDFQPIDEECTLYIMYLHQLHNFLKLFFKWMICIFLSLEQCV